MTYFACQFKEQGGYKLSTLKIIPGVNVHILNPLQWRMTDIKQDEFEGINTMWLNKCKPQSNWTIEKWMISLNRCIKEYRKSRTVKKVTTKKQTVKKSQLGEEVEIIKPINSVSTEDDKQMNSDKIEIIKPINSVPTEDDKSNSIKPVSIKPIGTISKIQNGAIYDLITDDSNPIKQITDTIKEDVKDFITKRLNKLQAEHGLNLECLIDFKLNLYFE